MMVSLWNCQLAVVDLPALKMIDFDSPNYVSKVELNDENKFVLRRTILNETECELTLSYEFENEGLVSLYNSEDDKQIWETAKYVAPGSPLPLFTRKIQSTLKKERFFLDLCREGVWAEKRNLGRILESLNTLDWDQGYLDLWNRSKASPFFLALDTPGPVHLDQLNLSLTNQSLFASDDQLPLDFTLPLVNKTDFADHLFAIVENAVKESLRSLYTLNSKIYDRDSILKGPSFPQKVASNLLPFISRFFGLALNPPKPSPVKRVDMMSLKLDIDHIANLMKSELLSREDLFLKSQRIHDDHMRQFIPMTKNKLSVLSQMIWKMQDSDPYRQMNHLLEHQLAELVAHLKDPQTTPQKFKIRFAEIFMIYYSQTVTGFDTLGKPSAYVVFITQYMTDIFNRIKLEMEGLAGLETRDKTRLMAKVQRVLINAYDFLKSNEPILLVNLPRLVKSTEILGENLLKEFRGSTQEDQKKFLASIDLLENVQKTSRKVKQIQFNPFTLANKKKVLF